MSKTNVAAFLELVSGRRGHFRLESGHHSALWLDLDPLFAEPLRIEPLVATLTNALRPHDVAVVCGPLLGGAFLAQLVAHALGGLLLHGADDAGGVRRHVRSALYSA